MDLDKREKRAKSIAAMGLVNRDGDRFKVSTPSLRGKQTFYEVWRDAGGKIRCNCLEFEEEITKDAAFRCEHILAVKYALVAKNAEPARLPSKEEKQAETSDLTAKRDDSGDVPHGYSIEDFKDGWKDIHIRFNNGKAIFNSVIIVGENCPFQQVTANNIVNTLNVLNGRKQKTVVTENMKEPSMTPDGFPSNPIARSLSDLITPKQVGMIKAISREIGIDPDEKCAELMDCKTDELSKRATNKSAPMPMTLCAGSINSTSKIFSSKT